MTRQSTRGRRPPRKGKGLLPPNPKIWAHEHHGLDLRGELGLQLDCSLDHTLAFKLIPGAAVKPHGALLAAERFLQHFRREGKSRWSGLAVSLPNGTELVLYNDSHSITRIRSTLMEEFFHLWLGHKRSVVRVLKDSPESRSHNKAVETEAFGSGAAALVPYKPLRRRILEGESARSIARHFEVSEDLIVFRSKKTKLYKQLVS